jgi:hypothetical protein
MNRRTLAAAIIFAVVTVLTGSAHATTLTITEGTVSAQATDFDISYNFGGDGFSVQGVDLGRGFPANVYTTGVIDVLFSGNTTITVNGLTCLGFISGNPPACHTGVAPSFLGSMTLTNPPIPGPPPVSDIPVIDYAPFTATGHLVQGDGPDLVGQGILEVTYCAGRGCPTLAVPNVRYTFSVPEPPPLVLSLLAFGLLSVLPTVRVLRRAP